MKAKPRQDNDSYPTFPLDTGVRVESSRRNIETIHWFKALITGSLVVIWLTIAVALFAAYMAFAMPLPAIYASATDGSMVRLEYSYSSADFGSKFVDMEAEKQSLLVIQGQKAAPARPR